MSYNNVDKAHRMRAMYKILKKNLPGTNTDDQKKFSFKKTVCIAALIKAVTASIEANHQTCIKNLASANGTSVDTIFSILHKFIGLLKLSGKRA